MFSPEIMRRSTESGNEDGAAGIPVMEGSRA
jgi:hypothetical protein